MIIPLADAPTPDESRARMWPLVVAAAVIVLIPIVVLATGAGVPFRNDFAAYWPVGRLLLAGQNPYDPGAIEALQRSVGDTLGGDSVVRYPPWSLPLLLPFAALPYVPGWYLWITLQVLLVGVSSVWLWHLLGGRGKPGIPLAVAFCFPAGLIVALGGQIGGVLLLGVSSFLWAVLHRRDGLAGASLGLLTLKAHLFLPLGLVVLLWAAREQRWRVPAVAVMTTIAGSALAVALRPAVFSDYGEFLRTPGTSWQRALALGTAASSALGTGEPWLQWVPAVLATILVVLLWRHFADRFDWRRGLPLILVLGLVSAPYLLVHDLVLLVPALLTMALCVLERGSASSRWLAGLAFAFVCIIVWIGQIAEHTLNIHVWIAPFVLILTIAASVCVPEQSGGAGE
jgi:hypothetical protein